ncbi:methionine synthase [Tissierella creatinini]|nr:methionine synthase [Tissierella creatinini]TJX63590.1 methionine synthase [Soehngenia saccharolytica]
MTHPQHSSTNNLPGVFICGKEDLKDLLKLDKNEILRYLSYNDTSLDEEMDKLIDSCMEEIMEISQYKYIYSIFDVIDTGSFLSLSNSTIELRGKAIREHLKSSKYVGVMAVTLGVEVENKIKYYGKVNLTRGVILDSCAAALVEVLCDYVEDKIKDLALGQGLNITSRFSPGYGDLPITTQSQILNSLNASRLIGLNVSESSILLPRKSVTAFIGLDKNVKKTIRKCSSCNLFATCQFSKGGNDSCAR